MGCRANLRMKRGIGEPLSSLLPSGEYGLGPQARIPLESSALCSAPVRYATPGRRIALACACWSAGTRFLDDGGRA